MWTENETYGPPDSNYGDNLAKLSKAIQKTQQSIETNKDEFIDCVNEYWSTCEGKFDWDKIIELAKFHKEEHDEILKGE